MIPATAATSHPLLLSPGRIGRMELRNRIVMSPMETMYGTPEGLPSQRTVDYFAARAEGGVGLITVGATGVDHQHPETPGGLHLGTAESVAAHRRLTEAVHAHGAKIQPQIVHAGPDGLGPEMYGVTSLGPSVIPSYLTGHPSEEATPEQIALVIDQLRTGTARAAEAGYDGIELHAAHGYMFLGSFLAPQRNRRTDRWRGDRPEGRLQVVLDAIAAIRAEVGPDFPITLRISGYERVAAGRPMHETAWAAPQLVAAGIDAFHVSGGVIDRLVTQMVMGSDYGDTPNVGAAAAVKEVVDVPVIAVGRLHDPDLAEQVLVAGAADFIALGRPLLADPELPRKLAAGRAGRVRRCISCENCIDSLEQRFSVDCAVNPRTGREAELPLTLAPTARAVTVVGGGPAGLEAARVAAARGHHVTLHERSTQLGGALVTASDVHADNRPFLDWLVAEVSASEVELRLGSWVETPLHGDPDVIVVATGGERVYPDVPGADSAHVWRGPDGLSFLVGGALSHLEAEATGSPARVVVIGAELAGVEMAETLAEAGHRVTLLEARDDFAPLAGWKRKTEHMDRLDRLDVTFHVGATVESIGAAAVRFTPAQGATRDLIADAVLLTGEVHASTGLAEALRAAHPDAEVVCIGDADGFGMLRKAVLDGAVAAHAL